MRRFAPQSPSFRFELRSFDVSADGRVTVIELNGMTSSTTRLRVPHIASSRYCSRRWRRRAATPHALNGMEFRALDVASAAPVTAARTNAATNTPQSMPLSKSCKCGRCKRRIRKLGPERACQMARMCSNASSNGVAISSCITTPTASRSTCCLTTPTASRSTCCSTTSTASRSTCCSTTSTASRSTCCSSTPTASRSTCCLTTPTASRSTCCSSTPTASRSTCCSSTPTASRSS